MAQARKASVVTEDVLIEEKPVVQEKQQKIKKDTWEIKDRTYVLKGNKTPLTYTLSSRHTSRYPLMWFDEELGYSRELRYASNQKSPFVDEQSGYSTLSHIVFRDGALVVPREQQSLQKLLSLYHPQRDKTYKELDNVQEAVDVLSSIELELEALTMATQIDIDHAEAILRGELGNAVSKMSSQEIKRDLMLFAKRDPELFLDLANDENIVLRNMAIKATEMGIIKLSSDQRTFVWASTNKKLITVPFDENPYSAMAAFFKTDDGIEVYQSVEKRLK